MMLKPKPKQEVRKPKPPRIIDFDQQHAQPGGSQCCTLFATNFLAMLSNAPSLQERIKSGDVIDIELRELSNTALHKGIDDKVKAAFFGDALLNKQYQRLVECLNQNNRKEFTRILTEVDPDKYNTFAKREALFNKLFKAKPKDGYKAEVLKNKLKLKNRFDVLGKLGTSDVVSRRVQKEIGVIVGNIDTDKQIDGSSDASFGDKLDKFGLSLSSLEELLQKNLSTPGSKIIITRERLKDGRAGHTLAAMNVGGKIVYADSGYGDVSLTGAPIFNPGKCFVFDSIDDFIEFSNNKYIFEGYKVSLESIRDPIELTIDNVSELTSFKSDADPKYLNIYQRYQQAKSLMQRTEHFQKHFSSEDSVLKEAIRVHEINVEAEPLSVTELRDAISNKTISELHNSQSRKKDTDKGYAVENMKIKEIATEISTKMNKENLADLHEQLKKEMDAARSEFNEYLTKVRSEYGEGLARTKQYRTSKDKPKPYRFKVFNFLRNLWKVYVSKDFSLPKSHIGLHGSEISNNKDTTSSLLGELTKSPVAKSDFDHKAEASTQSVAAKEQERPDPSKPSAGPRNLQEATKQFKQERLQSNSDSSHAPK